MSLVEKLTEFHSLTIAKAQKKYKHAKKALVTMQDFDGQVRQEKMSYPTGETPSQGDFNLATHLFERSGVEKEDYNMFIVRNSPMFNSLLLVNLIPTHSGINPSRNDCRQYSKDGSLARCPGRAPFGRP